MISIISQNPIQFADIDFTAGCLLCFLFEYQTKLLIAYLYHPITLFNLILIGEIEYLKNSFLLGMLAVKSKSTDTEKKKR